jgi:hypothetical protein
MGQNSPWEANSRSATEYFPNNLWQPKFNIVFTDLATRQLVPLQDKISPVHTTPYISEIQWSTIFLAVSVSSY